MAFEKEDCLLLMKAKVLAAKRNLPTELVNCPIIDKCVGINCMYLTDLTQLEIDQEDITYINNTRHVDDKRE